MLFNILVMASILGLGDAALHARVSHKSGSAALRPSIEAGTALDGSKKPEVAGVLSDAKYNLVKSLSDRLDKAEAALDSSTGTSESKKADTHATLADAIAGSGQSDVSPSKKPQDVDVIVTGAHGDGKAAVVHGQLRPSANGDGDGSGTLVVEESEAKRVRAQAQQDAASKPAGVVDPQAAESDQASSSAAAVVGGKVMDSYETMKAAGTAIGGSQALDAEDQASKDGKKNDESKNDDTKEEASDAPGSEASKEQSADRKGTSKAQASLSAGAIAAEQGSEQESQVGSTGHNAEGGPEEEEQEEAGGEEEQEEQEGGSKGTEEAAASPHPFVLFGSGASQRESSLARTLGLAAGVSAALAVAATMRP